MADYRFSPDPDFEITVEAAAMGTDKFGRQTVGARSRVRSTRRRRTTLLAVGEQIIDEAKRLAIRELPSRNSAGGRDPNFPWAAPDRSGRTYVQSFDMHVIRVNGRLVLEVFNNHDHAYDVEYGNAGGARRRKTRQTGYYAIPLTKAGVARFRRYAKSPEAKERARARAAKSYWTRRSIQLKERKGRLDRDSAEIELTSRRMGPQSISALDRKSIIARRKAYAESRQRAIAGYSRAVAQLGPAKPRTFVGVSNKTGKPTLFTQTFHTYRGYAILRHATRRVTLRTLE